MCFAGAVVAFWEERSSFIFFSGLLWVPQELLEANPARHRLDNMRGKEMLEAMCGTGWCNSSVSLPS